MLEIVVGGVLVAFAVLQVARFVMDLVLLKDHSYYGKTVGIDSWRMTAVMRCSPPSLPFSGEHV